MLDLGDFQGNSITQVYITLMSDSGNSGLCSGFL